MKYNINSLLIICSLFFLIHAAGASDYKGLLPVNHDGFETGDWRNFRPHYVGDAEDWIRPNFKINDSDPISGNYSLQWRSDDRTHKWLMLSNAFYLNSPLNVSIDFRVRGETDDFAAGLLLMESHDQYAGVKVSQNGAEIYKKGTATIAKPLRGMDIVPGALYRMSVSLSDDYKLEAEVAEKNSGRVVARFETTSFIDPAALSMYIRTGGGANTSIDFDDLQVESSDYLVPAGRYTRSPHFVVLPRLSDVVQDQGNWVGSQSTMVKDGEFLMWYRIRDNEVRGRGFGFARSQDGLNWAKYENNPLFTHDPEYSSNEKISVRKVDGLYRAWYAVHTPRGWFTAYATSEDGIKWEQHGLVIDETYCKDVDVVYLDGTYYLYSIKDGVKIGVYTSTNGVDFTHRNTIDIGSHRHVAAFYEKKTGLFHLYSTAGYNGVCYAVSENGIDFGLFKNVWNTPAVGLDDWVNAGITYLSFLTDEYGHLDDASALPVYYQARNVWNNNKPGWVYHGSDRVVLAGKYEGFYPGIATRIMPDGNNYYEAFPFLIPKADGLSITAMRPVRVMVDKWNKSGETIIAGSLRGLSEFPRQTQVQVKAEKLVPGVNYQFLIDGNPTQETVADKYGNLLFTFSIEQGVEVNFRISRNS